MSSSLGQVKYYSFLIPPSWRRMNCPRDAGALGGLPPFRKTPLYARWSALGGILPPPLTGRMVSFFGRTRVPKFTSNSFELSSCTLSRKLTQPVCWLASSLNFFKTMSFEGLQAYTGWRPPESSSVTTSAPWKVLIGVLWRLVGVVGPSADPAV